MHAVLRSNSGEAEIGIQFGAATEYAHDPGFESRLELKGCHWDGDHTFPFSTTIDGLWLRADDLEALRDHIAKWVSLPMNELVSDGLTRCFQLARLPGQRLSVQFGPRSDLVSGPNPVVSIVFSAGKLSGEFHFVTDQSCLNLFAHELQASLL
ncbi:MAG TPA: hypothetical protein VN887_09955 [Candidatus Angelobacter sp.]|nr:hypothetical protein [Candidatus Angelobacter sp.]